MRLVSEERSEELVGINIHLLGTGDETATGIVRLGEPISTEDHLVRDDAKGDIALFFLGQDW